MATADNSRGVEVDEHQMISDPHYIFGLDVSVNKVSLMHVVDGSGNFNRELLSVRYG